MQKIFEKCKTLEEKRKLILVKSLWMIVVFIVFLFICLVTYDVLEASKALSYKNIADQLRNQQANNINISQYTECKQIIINEEKDKNSSTLFIVPIKTRILNITVYQAKFDITSKCIMEPISYVNRSIVCCQLLNDKPKINYQTFNDTIQYIELDFATKPENFIFLYNFCISSLVILSLICLFFVMLIPFICTGCCSLQYPKCIQRKQNQEDLDKQLPNHIINERFANIVLQTKTYEFTYNNWIQEDPSVTFENPQKIIGSGELQTEMLVVNVQNENSLPLHPLNRKSTCDNKYVIENESIQEQDQLVVATQQNQ